MEPIKSILKRKLSFLTDEQCDHLSESIPKENLEECGWTVVKLIENLRSPYVMDKIKEGIWKIEDISALGRETLFPEKWQNLQEARLPKNVKKERVKGTNMCPRCKSWYTTYKQAQTRSGDEGLTTRCYCEDCEHHWKFS